MSKNKRPVERFYFVYKKRDGVIEIVHEVVKLSYHDEVETAYGKIAVKGSEGIFCNTIDEAFAVERNFDFLMDDSVGPEEFNPVKWEVPKEEILDIELKVLHNGILLDRKPEEQEVAEVSDEDKKHPDMDRNRTLVFECDSCGELVETLNGSWKADVPEKCPKCSQGSFKEIQAPPTRFFDRTREKNWDKGLSPTQQARVLSGEIDPY